jgi:hypothetical protein
LKKLEKEYPEDELKFTKAMDAAKFMADASTSCAAKLDYLNTLAVTDGVEDEIDYFEGRAGILFPINLPYLVAKYVLDYGLRALVDFPNIFTFHKLMKRAARTGKCAIPPIIELISETKTGARLHLVGTSSSCRP